MFSLLLFLALAFALLLASHVRRAAGIADDDVFDLPLSERLKRTGFLKVAGLVVAVVFFSGGALAAGDAAAPADVDLLKQLAIHAAGIAVFIRAVIALLRSPFLGLLWGKVPEPARVAVLLVLGAVAVAFDHIALGEPLLQAFAAAFAGLFGVVGGHEMFKRVDPRQRKPAR